MAAPTVVNVEYYIIQAPLMQGEIVVCRIDHLSNNTEIVDTTRIYNEDLVDLAKIPPVDLNDDTTAKDGYDIVRQTDQRNRISGVTGWRNLDSVIEFIDISNDSQYSQPVIDHYKFAPWRDLRYFQLIDVNDAVRPTINVNQWLSLLTEGTGGNYAFKGVNYGPRLDQCALSGKKTFKLPVFSDEAPFKDLTQAPFPAGRSLSDDDYLESSGKLNALVTTLPTGSFPVQRVINQRIEQSKCFNVFHMTGVDPGFKFQVNQYVYNEYYYSDAKQRLNENRGPVGNTRTRIQKQVRSCDDEFQTPSYKRVRRNY